MAEDATTANTVAVILAAGRGSRMKSELPKVAVPLLGKPMMLYVVESLHRAGINHLVTVIGYKKEQIIDLLQSKAPRGMKLEYAEQLEQRGTAHALQCCEPQLARHSGYILVACGDMPLISSTTIQKLLRKADQSQAAAIVLSAVLDHPTGYGRLVRNDSGELIRIVEERDANAEQRAITETNTGTYLFRAPEIFSALNEVGSNNAQGEYYLPDTIAILRSRNLAVDSLVLDNPTEALGANSIEDLKQLEEALS